MGEKISKPEAEWRETLEPVQYFVLRQKGTEPAFTGKYWDCKIPGTYLCAGCGQELFDAAAKFESRSGWPSFFQPLAAESVTTESDASHGMVRNEVLCSRCDSHLGHLFEDGPPPTGLRYCMNSASMRLRPSEGKTGD